MALCGAFASCYDRVTKSESDATFHFDEKAKQVSFNFNAVVLYK